MHPGGVPSLGATLRLLHKQRRADIIAHLRSLDHDARFVTSAHAALGEPPTFANLRCGVWHVPPTVASSGHCYFKSTDGHAGQWGFSLTRLNMQVAIAAVTCAGGVIIVDSTRSGKRYPDSLSKTVPIWCCVLNRAVAAARSVSSWDTALLLPPWVPPSEAAQIEERLAGWVEMLRRPALTPVLSRLAEVLDRPLRPSWLCPLVEAEASYAARASAVQEAAAARGAPFAWVHCVCASEVCTAEEARARASYTYIQGAGDDDENWARGLTAVQWWRWRDELIPLAARDHEAAERRLAELRERDGCEGVSLGGTEGGAAGGGDSGGAERGEAAQTERPCALWGSRLLLGPRVSAAAPAVWMYADAVLDVGSPMRGAGAVVDLAGSDMAACAAIDVADISDGASCPGSSISCPPAFLHVPIMDESPGNSKRTQPSRDWWQRVVLPRSLSFIHAHLSAGRRVVVCCERGDDRSPTIAAAALLALFEADATTLAEAEGGGAKIGVLSKEDVRARLALLQGAYPAARVPRRLLKELNQFFVAPEGGFLRWRAHARSGDTWWTTDGACA